MHESDDREERLATFDTSALLHLWSPGEVMTRLRTVDKWADQRRHPRTRASTRAATLLRAASLRP